MPSPRRPKPPRAPKIALRDIEVAVDPTLKKSYDALVAIIERASLKESSDFDAKWEAAGKIVDHQPALYVVGGFKNDVEFFKTVMNEEARNARRFVRVAKYASPEDETVYGITKIDAAIGFIEAKLGQPLEHPPLRVAFDKIRIPVKTGTVSLENATVAQVTAATSALLQSGKARPKSHARVALEAAIGEVASLEDVVVREHAGRVSFTNVPLAAISHFARAVAKAPIGAVGEAKAGKGRVAPKKKTRGSRR